MRNCRRLIAVVLVLLFALGCSRDDVDRRASQLHRGGQTAPNPAAEAYRELMEHGKEGEFRRDLSDPGKPVIELELPSSITDASLASLRGLSKLQKLSLHGCRRVTDQGLIHLRQLVQLQQLDLSDTPVSDAGLEHLAGLSQLRVLNLARTQVSDAGLTALAELPALKSVDLTKTRVTALGLANLKQRKPDLEIAHP